MIFRACKFIGLKSHALNKSVKGTKPIKKLESELELLLFRPNNTQWKLFAVEMLLARNKSKSHVVYRYEAETEFLIK